VDTLQNDIKNLPIGALTDTALFGIKQQKNSVQSEYQDVYSRYLIIRDDTALLNKLPVTDAFASYDSAYNSLIDYFDSAFNDSAITQAEKDELTARFTAYKNQVSLFATALQNAVKTIEEQKINNIQIGGRNLAIGSSNGIGWTYDYYSGTEFRASSSSPTESKYINSPFYTLKKGETITISFEAKQTTNINSLDFFILGNYTVEGFVIAGVNYPASVDWQKHTFTVIVPNTIVSPVRIRFDHNGSADGQVATIFVRNIKLEKGNKATDWTPAPEDVEALINQEIQDVENKITGLETTVNTTFKDGIIEQAEAKAIEKYINSLNAEKSDIDNQYNTIYNDALLTGTAKTNLEIQKASYNTAHSQLLDSINNAISDGKTTADEKKDVDSKFTNYKNVLGGFALRLTEALKAIEAKRLDNIQIGGRNLVKQSNKFNAGSVANGITPSVTAEGYLQVISGAGNGNWHHSWGVNNTGIEEQFNEGDAFTINFWVKRISGTGNPTIYIKPDMGYFPLSGDLNDTDFKPISYTGVWKKANDINFHLGWSSTEGTFRISKWKIEKGNKPTDWTPAPEDVDSAILTAQNSANTANNLLADIANDNILTPSEKQSTKKEWDIIVGEKTTVETQASSLGIPYSDYTNAYNTLSSYITPLLADLTTKSTIVGETFRENFKNYYNAKINLLKAVTDKLKSNTDNIQVGGRNLLKNSHLDNLQSVLSNGATISLDTAKLYNGRPTIKNVGTYGFYFKDLTDIEPNTEYTLSIMVFTNDVLNNNAQAGSVFPLHLQLPVNGHNFEVITKSNLIAEVGKWSKIWVTFKSSASTVQQLRWYIYSLGTNNPVWFSSAKLD
jgi:hypothetical protein